MLPARIGVAYGLGLGYAGEALVAALFVLPLLYTVPWGRAIWQRHTWWLLTVQAVLTYLPFFGFGEKWAVGLSGLLGGLLLLTLPARWSWPLFAAVVAIEGILRIGVLGVYPTGGVQFISFVFVVPLDMGLPLYGLVRLSDLVVDLRTARTELADLAVTQERLRAAARLRAAIGDRLDSVTALAASARAELRAPPIGPATTWPRRPGSRGRLPSRSGRWSPRSGGTSTAPRHVTGAAPSRPARDAGTRGGPGRDRRTSRGDRDGRRRHGDRPSGRRRLGDRHRAAAAVPLPRRPAEASAPARLAMDAGAPGAAAGRPGHGHARRRGISGIGMAAFPAGSALLLLTGWWAWLGFTVIAASVGVHWLALYPHDISGAAYLAAVAAPTGLAVYGLSRLTDLAEAMETARRSLAEAAADRERLRVAQDSHDLLGLGLAAVALKCDLAGRLIGRDNARLRAELDALIGLAAQTRADVQKVTAGDRSCRCPTSWRPPASCWPRPASRSRWTRSRYRMRSARCSPWWCGRPSPTCCATRGPPDARSG